MPTPDKKDTTETPDLPVDGGLLPIEDGPQEDALTRLLPWTVSILLHVGLVLLALFVVWSTVLASQDEQIIIPTARLSATPGAPLQIKKTPRLKADPIARRTVSPMRNKTPLQLLTQPRSDATLVGVLGSSGDANPFETTISGGGELRAQFLGSGGNARRIAFVIDASGSITAELPELITALKRSINQLSARQQFTVIFFQGNDVIEIPPLGINDKPATPKTRQMVFDWLDRYKDYLSPGRGSDPIRALRLAFKYEPQLVFLLSDEITGQGRNEIDQARLLNDIERINRTGTKINTLQFIYEDPLLKAGLRGTMELIAERSGGKYTFVSGSDLGID